MTKLKEEIGEIIRQLPIYNEMYIARLVKAVEDQLLELFKTQMLEIVGKSDNHTDHSNKDEWYDCVKCMDDVNKPEIRQRVEEL